MSVSKPKYKFKKGILDNKFNIAFIFFIVIPIFLFRNGVLDLTFASIFFVLLGNVFYFSLTNMFTIRIFENTTEFRNVFGKAKVIPNSKITFSETYFVREKGVISNDVQTLKLEIKFQNKKITLYKDEEENYNSLIKYCKENYSRFVDETINYWNYVIPTIIISLGIYFFIFTQNSFKKQKQDNIEQIQKYGYVKISGTYKDYETIGKGNTEIWYHLFEYPKFDFSPTEFARDKSKFYNLKTKGEKITIFISPNEYKKKIEKTVPLKFYDKYFQYNVITAYKVE